MLPIHGNRFLLCACVLFFSYMGWRHVKKDLVGIKTSTASIPFRKSRQQPCQHANLQCLIRRPLKSHRPDFHPTGLLMAYQAREKKKTTWAAAAGRPYKRRPETTASRRSSASWPETFSFVDSPFVRETTSLSFSFLLLLISHTQYIYI